MGAFPPNFSLHRETHSSVLTGAEEEEGERDKGEKGRTSADPAGKGSRLELSLVVAMAESMERPSMGV